MSVPVLTAISDPQREAELVAALQPGTHGVHVVRRCVDIADLVSAGAAGLARAVVLSADLRRLDRDALSRLTIAGVAVVGLAGDEAAERRLRQLGVRAVVAADAPVADIVAAVGAALADGVGAARDYAEPAASLADAAAGVSTRPADPAAAAGPGGRLIAVWGPAGAPGRSTVAVSLAAECATARAALLVDADVYGGVVAALLGLLDEAPGFAAACRQANQGTLDVPALAALAVEVGPRLRVLTGITRPQRWPELRPSAVEVVLAAARHLADMVVVDCGFCLEQDEELSYDTAAPRRNGATLAVLEAADTVVGVAAADPIGIQRYVRALGELGDALPGRSPITVVNQVRRGPTGRGDPRREIAAALDRYAGVGDPRFVPYDRSATDAALAAGRTLTEVAPKSPARLALRDLAAELSQVGATAG